MGVRKENISLDGFLSNQMFVGPRKRWTGCTNTKEKERKKPPKASSFFFSLFSCQTHQSRYANLSLVGSLVVTQQQLGTTIEVCWFLDFFLYGWGNLEYFSIRLLLSLEWRLDRRRPQKCCWQTSDTLICPKGENSRENRGKSFNTKSSMSTKDTNMLVILIWWRFTIGTDLWIPSNT